MNEAQVKEAISTLKALVESQEKTDPMAKIGAAAGMVLLESFLINQIRQTAALEQLSNYIAGSEKPKLETE